MKKIFLALIIMVTTSFSDIVSPTYYTYGGVTYVKSGNSYNFVTGVDLGIPTPLNGYSYQIMNFSSTSLLLIINYCTSIPFFGRSVGDHVTQNYVKDTGTCQSPSIIVNGECVIPTCGTNGTLNQTTQQCDCNPGYFSKNIQNEDGTATKDECRPLVDCPSQMKYFWTDQATDITGLFKTTYYTCLPRTDLSEPDCASQGGTYYKKSMMGESVQDYYTMYILEHGEGCVNEQWIKSDVFRLDSTFLMSGFILGAVKPFPASLANKAVSEKQLLLEYKNKQGDFPLTKYEPVVEDLGMTSEGVTGNIGFNPKNAVTDAETTAAYNKFLKDNGYITDTSEVPSAPVNDLGVDPAVTSKIGDNFYKGDDVTKFGDNMLGSANMASKGTIPDLAPATSAPVGATVATKIDLSQYLNKTEVQSYPVAVVKQSEKTNVDGSVATVYKGKVTYPDATVADFTVNQIKQSTGATVNEVGYSYIVNTANGTKTFNGAYTTTTDATGTVTNTVNKPSNITQVNDDGSISTSSNAGSQSVETDRTETAINLSPIIQRLDQIKNKLDEIQLQKQKEWEYTSPKTAEAVVSLTKLTQAFTNYSVSLDTLFDFTNGLFSDLKNLFQAFDDAKNQLTDKPTVNIPNGTCPFTISGANRTGGPIKTYTIDPCMFVAPRKPFLTVFFTLLFSWGVIMFAIKHLFNTTPNA
ncbi:MULTISPECIES: hypothetical protein [unclassified Sulfurospirillum]|uniref:hypothetical protein n=1 Tax=unclassified Sulfurospirillum TaxID=2618290 RepID=UPI0005059D6D|nr:MULTISPECIES: hypothetical protein [unclassified Sulfurospirillum]KFL34346.1 hypothetical protein JU57_06170 [Sulfurospirillum sp. SCADC]